MSNDEMRLIMQRISDRRKELDMSYQTLSDKTGISKSSLQRYETGYIKNMPLDKLKIMASALNCSPSYLMGWDNTSQGDSIHSNKPVNKTRLIPLVGTVACGNPIYAEENIEEYITVSADDRVDFALCAKGDSMNNCKIDDGDIVYIRQQPIVNNGEIALVLVDDSATIKRFYDYGDKIVLRPDSTNTCHKEQVYDKKSYNILVQGKIIFIKTFVN